MLQRFQKIRVFRDVLYLKGGWYRSKQSRRTIRLGGAGSEEGGGGGEGRTGKRRRGLRNPHACLSHLLFRLHCAPLRMPAVTPLPFAPLLVFAPVLFIIPDPGTGPGKPDLLNRAISEMMVEMRARVSLSFSPFWLRVSRRLIHMSASPLTMLCCMVSMHTSLVM